MLLVKMRRFALMCLLLSCASTAWGANILGIFPMPSYSHYSLGHRLLEELASRGHQVTMISPFKLNKKIENYSEIHLNGLAEIMSEAQSGFFDMEAMPYITQIILCHNLGYTISNFTLKHQSVLDFVKSKPKIDAVIIDHFVDESLLAIPYKLNAPIIYLCTLGASTWSNHLVANAAPLSHVPNIFLSYNGKMNFIQRLHNLALYVMEEVYRRRIAYPIHEQIVHESFPELPDLNTLIYSKTPFVLVNSHISTNHPMPHVPNMVEIGGFHPRKQELPQELKEFLDKSKHGVIFFGMGSNLKVTSLPTEKREAILKALGKLKQDVLWKWEEDNLPGQPPNVKTMKWLPQQAILGHPNTKAFISHAGLLSTIESVYFGVPIIGIPIYADQKMNINLAVNRGYGLSVPFSELTEETLSEALDTVLNNETYRLNAKHRQTLIQERPVSPLQEAMFWIEHVIKHNGSEHFRHSGMDLRWYEYQMLDVAAVLIAICLLIFFGLYSLVKKLFCSKVFTKRTSKKSMKKKTH